ncbi:MAG: hypothetical protein U5K79_23205 [Cyclobacteriaceae bacterium]|nr:hypothetical protein [Cyclobacteriaceae bacterium]
MITCSPDGTAQIDAISEDGAPVASPFAGWNLSLLDNNQNSIANPGTGVLGNPYAGLGPNTYFLRAQNTSTECFSDPFMVQINDVSQSPLIAVVLDNPDYACSGTNFTGILNPTISGGSDNDVNQTNYSIVWTSIASGLPTAVDAANRAIDLQAGDYRITVMDNIGFDAGCQTVQDFIVTSARHTIIVAASATNHDHLLRPDGTAQIDAISEDGAPVASPFAGWNLSLLDNNQNSIANSGTGVRRKPIRRPWTKHLFPARTEHLDRMFLRPVHGADQRREPETHHRRGHG